MFCRYFERKFSHLKLVKNSNIENLKENRLKNMSKALATVSKHGHINFRLSEIWELRIAFKSTEAYFVLSEIGYKDRSSVSVITNIMLC